MTLQQLFSTRPTDLLSIYFTAGFPQRDSMPNVLDALAAAGADLVEIGIPYSDPLSDGPTIQESSAVALQNGMTLELLFEQLQTVNSPIPLVMMGYFNPVLQFGMERFCEACHRCGVSGIIIPDLPLEHYLAHYASLFEKHGLSMIFLVTPETSEARIQLIDKHSSTFIYAVSSSSTTGNSKSIDGARSYLTQLQSLQLEHPFLVGFNISTSADFQFACQHSSGGIIGSAFIKTLAAKQDLRQGITSFIHSIKNTVNT